MKWRIKRIGSTDGVRYITTPRNEPGTILFFDRPTLATVFTGSKERMLGFVAGLKAALGDEFQLDPIINNKKSTDEKVDDIYEGG